MPDGLSPECILQSFFVKNQIQFESPKARLTNQRCKPCEDGKGRLGAGEARALKKQLRGGWKIASNRKIHRDFHFEDFKGALRFTNQVGELAEKEGHHPDIYLTYGQVSIELSTHAAKGLTLNDFILAAKIDALT